MCIRDRNNELVYLRDQQLFIFSMETLEEKEIVLSKKLHPFEQIHVQGNLFFFVKKEETEIYKWQISGQ